MKKYLSIAALFPVLLCGCAGGSTIQEILMTAEVTADTVVLASTEEPEFSGTLEELPPTEEFSPADPLDKLNIQPSDYFKPGVYTSSYTDDTGNFYIFDPDGIHGRLIPMADAEGVDFTYSITGNQMTMYVGEELTPYSAELETTDEGHIIIHMTYLETSDELEYLRDVSPDGFSFYPAKKLAQLARKYYERQTGRELMGTEYYIHQGDLVVVNLYVADENGWRSDVDSYTLSMFNAKGGSSITYEDIDLSAVTLTEEASLQTSDDIPDISEPD